MGKKLSQHELARRLGTSDSLVSQWMNGDRTPSVLMLHRIAEALGVMVSELFKQPRHAEF